MNQKIQTAIEILRTYGVTGNFCGAMVSQTNGNEAEFYLKDADGIYCTVNIRSKAVKGL